PEQPGQLVRCVPRPHRRARHQAPPGNVGSPVVGGGSGLDNGAGRGRPVSSVTWRPFPPTGQLVRTGHARHRLFTTAENVDAAMVAAVRLTIAAAHSGSAACDSGGCTCSRTLTFVPSWTSAAPPLSVPYSSNAPPSTAAW